MQVCGHTDTIVEKSDKLNNISSFMRHFTCNIWTLDPNVKMSVALVLKCQVINMRF